MIGYNYHFGRHGAGTHETMREFGKAFGFDTVVLAEVRLQGGTVSSTRIRQLMEAGDTAQAETLLGHPPA